MEHPERSGRIEPVLNEAESETEAKATTADPVDDPSARRCMECGELLSGLRTRTHAGRCARARKTRLQKIRRGRGC
jgi:hypothetical protein